MRSVLPFPDFQNMFNDLPHDLAWLGFAKAFDYLFKNRKTIFRIKNFHKNYNWFRIGCHIISFLINANFSILFSKLKLKPLEKICNAIITHDFKVGLSIFQKIEPELTIKIAEFVTRMQTDYKIYKTTGIKSEFLMKYLPNATP